MKTGLITKDDDLIKTEIIKLTEDTDPAGETGKNDLEKLVEQMNKLNGISAEIICDNCMENLPNYSEILVKVDSTGILTNRLLEMRSNGTKPFAFNKIYSYSKSIDLWQMDSHCFPCFVEDLSNAEEGERWEKDYVALYTTINPSADSLIIKVNKVFLCGTVNENVTINNDLVLFYIENKPYESSSVPLCGAISKTRLPFKLLSDTTTVEVDVKLMNEDDYQFVDQVTYIHKL